MEMMREMVTKLPVKSFGLERFCVWALRLGKKFSDVMMTPEEGQLYNPCCY